MRKGILNINTLPIKWRITVWASLWMCIFFLLYNSVQYLVLDRWTLKQEELAIKKSMDEIIGYYEDNGSRDVTAGKSFLEKANQNDQLIRLLDLEGNPLLTISDGLPAQWVSPQPVETTLMVSVRHEREHLLILRSPLQIDSFNGTIEIVRNLENYEKLNQMLLLVMVLGGLGGIAFSSIGGVLLGRQFVKPIAKLSGTIANINYNGLSERVDFINNNDELSKLGQLFNEMMDRLETSFEQQNQFVEDASHELRTPIAIIEGHLKLLSRWGKDDPAILNESLNASLEELVRLKNLTQDLLASSHSEPIHMEKEQKTEPNRIIMKVVEDFAIIHPNFIFDVNYRSLSHAQLAVSAHHLKQILMIVIDNAIKYSTNEKTIMISGNTTTDHKVQLRIADKGVGISEEHIPFVFDRFYRIDKARSRKVGGSGLGLAIAKRLAEAYHGSIHLTSVENEGTVVTIVLPRWRN
ncbi:cell wall metabolism sensor histidine kinase WalK [Cohnella sp. WQ 127256]|uniref:sensor histidine kinase n=1 Tax=Cohnella sp. WQ 127256 TaxID=2938790 RepID=UPI002119A534|nr:HAMP domain-containing histidine kinase [Cohnella sp. WQ 127256]